MTTKIPVDKRKKLTTFLQNSELLLTNSNAIENDL